MIHLILKGHPVSVNNTYARSRHKAVFINKEASAYGDNIAWQAKIQYRDRPLKEDLEVTCEYYFGTNRTHDHLNYNKLLFDRLNQIVWADDKQIKISHHFTKYDAKNPRIELFIKTI